MIHLTHKGEQAAVPGRARLCLCGTLARCAPWGRVQRNNSHKHEMANNNIRVFHDSESEEAWAHTADMRLRRGLVSLTCGAQPLPPPPGRDADVRDDLSQDGTRIDADRTVRGGGPYAL